MADVRDILGVARGNASSEKADAPAKAPKERVQRPAGMSREAFALLGGSHPIVPAALSQVGAAIAGAAHCIMGCLDVPGALDDAPDDASSSTSSAPAAG